MTDEDVRKRTITVASEHVSTSIERVVSNDDDYKKFILGSGSKNIDSHTILPGCQMFAIADFTSRKYMPKYLGSVSGISREGLSWTEMMEMLILGGTYSGTYSTISGQKIKTSTYPPQLTTYIGGMHDAAINTWSGELYATDHVFAVFPKFTDDGTLVPGQYAKDIELVSARPLLTMPLRAIPELKWNLEYMKTAANTAFNVIVASVDYITATDYEKLAILMTRYSADNANNGYKNELQNVYDRIGRFNIPKYGKFDHCYLGVSATNSKPGKTLKLIKAE